MTDQTNIATPCECDLTDDHGEAAELRRRLEARGSVLYRDGRGRVEFASTEQRADFDSGAQDATREDAMVVLRWDGSGTPTVWCDPEIVDLVDALNTDSLSTVASCSGHGERPGFISMRDGRTMILYQDHEDALAALTAQPVAQEPVAGEDCKKCCGNGEIVTDWDGYLHPPEGAEADHGTTECPACSGYGKIAHPATPAPVEAGLREAMARLIYERGMLFMHTGKPAWVERGNSIAQTEARRIVDDIIDTLRAQSAPVGGNHNADAGNMVVNSVPMNGEAPDDFARLCRIDGVGQVLITIEAPEDEDGCADDEMKVQFRIPDIQGIAARLSITAASEDFARSGMRSITEDQIRATIQPMVDALAPFVAAPVGGEGGEG